MKGVNASVLILICLIEAVFAQEVERKPIRFSGVVMDGKTTEPLANVNCRRGERVSATDLAGRFALETEIGDTIFFTYIGMQPTQVVVPDTLTREEYILAVFMFADTLLLPEVVVVPRYRYQMNQYRRNLRNNMLRVRQDAFSPALDMTLQENQQRILDEFAASTNKGHVDVKLGIGTESYRALYSRIKQKTRRNESSELLRREEIDLLKMLFSLRKQDK
ncbi:carboxypeptidase-like regulatory domain-containing protein [Odoribacter lunatus]|uniref:carboxypeptidase-like regulatory domain-containing protein n=1 Tax=Odoribacter lunatus TaxID=2941335 RepID=UPI00203E66C0|nr:carboxypeptidase-like regulatory domain-containing protein [Odoribacter lunatus]